MRLTIPRLRTWHLLGIVAASAAFFSVMQLRWTVDDPVYALIRQLRSTDPIEREKAANGLGGIRPPERRAIAPLLEMLSDPDPRPRASAARALSVIVEDEKDEAEVGPIRAALTSALGDRDPAARLEAARALAFLKADPKGVVPILLEFARDQDARVRVDAISILGLLYGRKSEPALATLFAGLGDAQSVVRIFSAEALGYCATRPTPSPEPLLGRALAALIEAADDDDPTVRAGVARTLGHFGERIRAEIPRVVRALGDPDADVRLSAANYLPSGRPGKRSRGLIEALERTLKDQDARVRRASAERLGDLGYDAEPALAALRGQANDPVGDVADRAADSILAIEKSARDLRTITLPEAIAELGDADPVVRCLAATRLEELGSRAAGAVPSLVRCLGDREADVRRASVEALGQLGPGAAVAVEALAKLAEADPDERVRRSATLSRSILTHREGSANQAP